MAAKGLIGQVREKLGWLTADRKEEARGRLEQAEASGIKPDEAKGDDRSVEQAVDQAELDMRDEYGDLAPGVKDT
ncbi:MAG: hypothetical protein JO291_10925 [Acidimicrobiia bacterium]|nr:hypothetical protein [Acidimicrobiia bacterium]